MHTGRIITQNKTNYRLFSEGKEYLANVRGSFFEEMNFPKVGDYVVFTIETDGKATIESIEPRHSVLSRVSPETGDAQIIVTNVDRMFIVMGLDGDFNVSRLERYLQLAKQSSVSAVIVLNKADRVENIEEYLSQVREISQNTPVHAISAKSGDGMQDLLPYIGKDETVVLLGSSGAGKSTMTNWLLGENKQSAQDVRSDDSRGRHTTTARNLFALPSGGFLIDTPGMRELGLVDESKKEEETIFAAIDELAQSCQFSDCDHQKSKGCAVLQAIADGELTLRQLTSYQKIHSAPAQRVFKKTSRRPYSRQHRKEMESGE